MAKYQIQTSPQDANYRLMSATAEIHTGEEILTEVPLVSLKVGLSDLFDPDRFYTSDSIYNGARALQTLRDSLAQNSLNRLQALYNKDRAGNSFSGLIATNAFGDDEEEGGQFYMVLRLYDEISRVNHACRPNAVMMYDGERGRGVLRALQRITAGQEILIEYHAQEENSLLGPLNRREALEKHYGFTCQCVTCTLAGAAKTTDTRLRREALGRFKVLYKLYPGRVSPGAARRDRANKLPKVVEYVDRLEQLHVRDGKLGWAYRKLADIHEELYEIARDETPAGQHHCGGCRDNGGRSWHLDQASTACNKALVVDIRVYGQHSRMVAATQEQIQNIMHDRQNED